MKFKELYPEFKKLPMWLKFGMIFGFFGFLLATLSYFRIPFLFLGSGLEILFLIILLIPIILFDLIKDALFYGWIDLPKFPMKFIKLFLKNEWGSPTFIGIIFYTLLWFFIGVLIILLFNYISTIVKKIKKREFRLPMCLKFGMIFGFFAYLLEIYYIAISLLYKTVIDMPLYIEHISLHTFFHSLGKDKLGGYTNKGTVFYVLFWFIIGVLTSILITFISKIFKKRKEN